MFETLINMVAKMQKVETNEEFIRAWHEETYLWDVISILQESHHTLLCFAVP